MVDKNAAACRPPLDHPVANLTERRSVLAVFWRSENPICDM